MCFPSLTEGYSIVIAHAYENKFINSFLEVCEFRKSVPLWLVTPVIWWLMEEGALHLWGSLLSKVLSLTFSQKKKQQEASLVCLEKSRCNILLYLSGSCVVCLFGMHMFQQYSICNYHKMCCLL